MNETLMWTALPNGTVTDPAVSRLRLSVFISPRLNSGQPLIGDQPDTTLGAFPDFVDWPARVGPGQVSFSVRLRTEPDPVQARTARIVSPPPSSAHWASLFNELTPVTSHTFQDLTKRAISTYSISDLHAHLRDGYRSLAGNAPTTVPDRTVLEATFRDLFDAFRPGPAPPEDPLLAPASAVLSESLRLQTLQRSIAADFFRPDPSSDMSQRIVQAIATGRAAAKVGPPGTSILPAGGPPASEFARLVTFHRGPTSTTAGPEPAGPPSALDFHQALTFLGDFPQLLRILGLIIDLEIDGGLPLSPSEDPHPGELQVIPDFIQPFAGTNISPFTAFIREGKNFFEPAPSLIRPDIVHGLLNLQLTQGPAAAARPVFQAIHLDVDGAGLKLLNTVAHETGSQSGPVEQVVEGEPAPPLTPNDPAEVGGVSSLRTSGVTIARSGHGELLGQRIQTSKTNNDRIEAGDLPTLFAEDLVRGYRCDVFDIQTGVWRSLHRRIGTYTFKADDGPAPLTIIDEGAVQPALTRPIGADGVKPDDDAELYIHESLAHWQGWSLAAPRPGLTVTDNGPAAVTSQAPANGVPLEVTFEAEPGTLPRLRFGRRYRFRARTVDLAGNGLDVDEATTLHDEVIQNELHQPRPILPGDRELPLAYHRFEPVISPVLVPRQRFNEGESLEHLVIRSRTDADTAGEAVALTAMSAGASYSATCERHVVPPKTSQSMAEMSGLLDASFGTHTAFDLTYEIARREKGRLTDPDDPNSPNVETVASGSAESPYVVHHEAQLTVPYLPDPFSAGAALFGLPHQTLPAAVDSSGGLAFGPSTLPPGTLNELGGSSVHISFGDRWPERVPFRLVLTEAGNDAAPAAPTWDPTTRELTVFLAKAEQVTFQLASFMKDTDLGQMGIWQWLAEEKVPGIGEIQTAVEGGRWQLTPARTISLVHAVEQPLVAPQLESLDTPRDPGDTVAYIAARIPVHGQSTSKIDLMASWSEDVDPPGSPRQQLNAHVFAVPIHLPGDGPPDPGDLLIPPGVVPVVPIAAYDPSADVLHLQGNFPRQGLNVLSRQHFGDTKHRTVDYQASATTRFGEYFPAQIFNDADRLTVAGAPATSVIRSSARPAAPKVVSVLPTFRWSRPVQANGVRASARSSGIRVYMERPWFSSGDGELLGIILTDEANFPPDDTLAPFVSHWAQDPIFGTEPLRMQLPTGESIGVPRAELPPGHNNGSFPKATATASSLTLQELSAAIPATDNPSGPDRVDVAGHVVEYDAFRNLLYCDIDIDTPTGTYFPFVRLALARYQPNSLAGLELSRVVVADFVQVPPSRIATLSLDPNDPNAFDVELSGTTYTSNAWTPFFSGKIGVSNPASDIPPPPLVTVTVEERIPNTSDDVGWVPADPLKFSVEVTTAVQAGGTAINNEQLVADVIPTTLWTGKVRVPADRSPEQVRIVVREHEHLNTDTVVSKSVVLSDPNQQNFQAAQFPTQRLVVAPGEGRLVFAETFVL